MNESESLLPCPFCGSEAEFVRDSDEDGDFVAVQCTGCGCGSGKHYPIMDSADDKAAGEWNTRALQHTPEPVAWRDIESAPRDGTDVLLWAPHWKTAATGWTFGSDPWQGCRKDTVTKPPTHWMPIPAQPLAALSLGGEADNQKETK